MSFPDAPIAEIKSSVADLTGIDSAAVVGRPLRPVDPGGAAGVFAVEWTPVDHEVGQHFPAIDRYRVDIHVLVKAGSEQDGISLHYPLAKRVREMLYRDTGFRVRFAGISETSSGITERVSRWGVQQQRFVANEVQGSFLFLSVTELWFEAEVVG